MQKMTLERQTKRNLFDHITRSIVCLIQIWYPNLFHGIGIARNECHLAQNMFQKEIDCKWCDLIISYSLGMGLN